MVTIHDLNMVSTKSETVTCGKVSFAQKCVIQVCLTHCNQVCST